MIYLIRLKTRDGDKVIRNVIGKINRAADMFKIIVTPSFWALLIISAFQPWKICSYLSVNCLFKVMPQHLNRLQVRTSTRPFQVMTWGSEMWQTCKKKKKKEPWKWQTLFTSPYVSDQSAAFEGLNKLTQEELKNFKTGDTVWGQTGEGRLPPNCGSDAAASSPTCCVHHHRDFKGPSTGTICLSICQLLTWELWYNRVLLHCVSTYITSPSQLPQLHVHQLKIQIHVCLLMINKLVLCFF